MEDVKLEYYAL